jgi:hypothetical protein
LVIQEINVLVQNLLKGLILSPQHRLRVTVLAQVLVVLVGLKPLLVLDLIKAHLAQEWAHEQQKQVEQQQEQGREEVNEVFILLDAV